MSTNPFTEPNWPLEPAPGATHIDDQGRLWTSCLISYGARGGRWAYAHEGQSQVVIDTRQHLQSVRFVGMLAAPWDGLTKQGWVLARAHCSPSPEKIESAPHDAVRFERLEEPPEED